MKTTTSGMCHKSKHSWLCSPLDVAVPHSFGTFLYLDLVVVFYFFLLLCPQVLRRTWLLGSSLHHIVKIIWFDCSLITFPPLTHAFASLLSAPRSIPCGRISKLPLFKSGNAVADRPPLVVLRTTSILLHFKFVNCGAFSPPSPFAIH